MTDVETVLGFFGDDYEFDEAAFRDATVENFPRLDDEAAGNDAAAAGGDTADADTDADDEVAAEADA